MTRYFQMFRPGPTKAFLSLCLLASLFRTGGVLFMSCFALDGRYFPALTSAPTKVFSLFCLLFCLHAVGGADSCFGFGDIGGPPTAIFHFHGRTDLVRELVITSPCALEVHVIKTFENLALEGFCTMHRSSYVQRT